MIPDFFYSDPHFGHANVIKYCDRPFASVDEMDEFLIRAYCAVVPKDATTLWLGDCFFGGAGRAAHIMNLLPGNKILCLGNHDGGAARMARIGFDMVTDMVEMNTLGKMVRANHYPYRGTPSRKVDTSRELPHPERRKGEILIHGHTHSKVRAADNQIHVGVDAWGYTPVPMAEVARLIQAGDL